MTTRLKSGTSFGVSSGYEDSGEPGNYEIPSCGLEDVDKAFFRMFKDELAFQVSNDSSHQQKVPVVFAVGEKWSMLKSGRALRDKDGTLILPLITMYRSSVEKGTEDVVRGMNQHVGSFTVKRRLSPLDRAYQNLLNKSGIPNAEDISGHSDVSLLTPLETERNNTLENAEHSITKNGGLLMPSLDRNVWETIVIPTPQFYTAVYQITFWTQYTSHMNQMIERLMASYLPTGNRTLQLVTDKGYYFVAYVDETASPEDNYTDTTGTETIRKCKLTVRVPAYLVETTTPGFPNGARRYVSAPQLQFASIQLGSEPSASETYADNPETLLLATEQGNLNKANVPLASRAKKLLNPFNLKEKLKVLDASSDSGETIYSLVDDEDI